MRGPGEVDIPNEAHLLGSILSRTVTEIFVFYPPPKKKIILTAAPNGDISGGLALGSDIKMKITIKMKNSKNK